MRRIPSRRPRSPPPFLLPAVRRAPAARAPRQTRRPPDPAATGGRDPRGPGRAFGCAVRHPAPEGAVAGAGGDGRDARRPGPPPPAPGSGGPPERRPGGPPRTPRPGARKASATPPGQAGRPHPGPPGPPPGRGRRHPPGRRARRRPRRGGAPKRPGPLAGAAAGECPCRTTAVRERRSGAAAPTGAARHPRPAPWPARPHDRPGKPVSAAPRQRSCLRARARASVCAPAAAAGRPRPGGPHQRRGAGSRFGPRGAGGADEAEITGGARRVPEDRAEGKPRRHSGCPAPAAAPQPPPREGLPAKGMKHTVARIQRL